MYTSHEGGFEMNGNKGTDGLLYADRTPLPNYYELQHNYARAFVEIDNGKLIIDNSAAQKNLQSSIFNLQCHNRYDFLNLKDNVIFHWHLTADRDTVASGDFSPDCPPRSSVSYPLSIPQAAVPSDSHKPLTLLHFDIEDTQGHTFLHQSFVLSKPEWKELRQGMKPMKPSIQRGPLVRAGRKPTMAERIKQEGRLPQRYLLPADNAEVKADVHVAPAEGGQRVSFTLLPDTADVFRSELGLAWLLDKRIDRVQWIGQGPFASYPGRHQACRYGLWAKRMDDLYFEGNHSGIDAALLTDSVGNGILVVGDSLHLNFEQTDRGLVLTVNAAVSGQGPKFAKTAFNAWKPGDKAVGGECLMYGIRAGKWPEAVSRLFGKPDSVPAPFKPFLTQYDTYLMRYADIAEE